jgi:hypothetical protein
MWHVLNDARSISEWSFSSIFLWCLCKIVLENVILAEWMERRRHELMLDIDSVIYDVGNTNGIIVDE